MLARGFSPGWDSRFPAILLLGGVVHESTPIPGGGIHRVDWVVKLIIIGALIGLII